MSVARTLLYSGKQILSFLPHTSRDIDFFVRKTHGLSDSIYDYFIEYDFISYNKSVKYFNIFLQPSPHLPKFSPAEKA